MNAEHEIEQHLDAVRKALSGLRFGSIEITVHDGRVVQIERREKVRVAENGRSIHSNGHSAHSEVRR